MNELDKLFTFPIIMIDGDNEERKQSRNQALALDDDDNEIDVIIGHAECPYYDFVSISDRWLPSHTSLQRAIDGKFEACNVVFGQSGTFMVPWTREKFKDRLRKFTESQPKQVELTFDLKKVLENAKLEGLAEEETEAEEND